MSKAFISGNWTVKEGDEEAFTDAWGRFLGWTEAEFAGLRWAMLLHDRDDTHHFVSVAEWDSAGQRDAWRTDSDFPAHFGACRELCDELRAADYVLVSSIGSRPLIR